MSLRILVVAPFPPRIAATHGGAFVVARLALELATAHEVGVVCLQAAGEDPVDAELAGRLALLEHVPRSGLRTGRERTLHAAAIVAGWARGRPRLVTNYKSDELDARIAAVVGSWRPDVVQFEFHLLGGYLHAAAGVPRVVVVHEPGAHAAASASALTARVDGWAWSRFERRVARTADALVAFTDDDLARVQAWSPRRAVRIPFGMDAPRVAGKSPTGDVVLFYGNYSHAPNRRAATRLVESIFPRVRSRVESARLVLAGGPPGVELPRGAGVEHVGFVPDVAALLAAAAVVAVPIDAGGGMRVKVAESLAAGKAVVTTSRALAGIEAVPGIHCVTAEGDDEFADEIVRLLRDREARDALGTAARELAASTLRWQDVARAFAALYDDLRADAGTVRRSGSVPAGTRATEDE